MNRLSERLGSIPAEPIDIWLHTVSVGEFIAAKPIIIKLLAETDCTILITCTTVTGSELISKFIVEQDNNKIKHYYYPYDITIICRRFLNKTKPKLAIFFETEIWPKMYKSLKKRNIRLYLVNARLSEKSYNNYKKIQKYIKTVINSIDYIGCQSAVDYNYFIKLGYNPKKIDIVGNIKYNLFLPEDLDSKSSEYKKLFTYNKSQEPIILIAASTHNNEEEIILKIYIKLKLVYPNLILILAPRHPERFGQVYNLSFNYGLKTIKYSEFNCSKFFDSDPNFNSSFNSNFNSNFEVYILDIIGQLLYFYNVSDLAFIGGSLVPVGGHNPLEPAALRIPSIIGPNYYNFTDIVNNLISNNGLLCASSELDLQEKILILLEDVNYRKTIGANAYHCLQEQTDILNNYFSLVTSGLTSRSHS
ncbi:MAG: 3-deoxy-D-manno-octulosonic acid transferase [Gammaproteobacteria bacterium]|nr:3-deoxy-D-manno-octulosonic acid transferase [Gammaproteobacteria bacterium]